MDLVLGDIHLRLQRVARDLARDTLAAGVAEREARQAIDPGIIRALGERGLLGVNLPEDFGGAGAGVVAYAVALREIAAVDPSVAVTMAVTNMVGEVIRQFGSDAQRDQHIALLCRGEYFGGAFALSEPGAGSDAASLRTKATRAGGGWVLNGEKMWITTGDAAGIIVVWARTDDGDSGHRGISCFLVEQGCAGLTAGKPEDKMGLRASHTVALSLADVEVPASALLGEEGEGFRIAMVALDGGRIGIGSQSAGIGRAALERTREFLRAESDAAPGEGYQFDLADMATELDAAWLLVLRAAWLKEQGRRFSREAAMAKVFASEAANRAARRAVQILGGHGTLEAAGVARLLRDVRVAQIYEGTSEIQRLVIGRDVARAS